MKTHRDFKRVVLIVLDGVGVGALPDAASYGDAAAATLPHVAEAVDEFGLPNLQKLGLGNICQIKGVPPTDQPQASWGKMASLSAGKDSITGHWEIAGLVKSVPFPSFPQGFPAEIIDKFSVLAGIEPLGNIAASGTDILRLLGAEHLLSGRPIVYTSSDSVFQIAAHEDVLPPAQLYRLCIQTLEMLRPYGVCRVIARPFVGDSEENFMRTARRHDFPIEPEGTTVLDLMQAAGFPTCGIGKVGDLFAERGLDRSLPTRNNSDGMQRLQRELFSLKEGLIFVNLVDFDMLYGHRLDSKGFARALTEFDQQLPAVLQALNSADLLLITADHGCDPTTPGTDHSREYVPLLAWSQQFDCGRFLGERASFSDVAATIGYIFGLGMKTGANFFDSLRCD
ncbi:phosphopentomutase [Geopsychrobacter electrodiphilus]|uniref:phosphopentomutase n=1 Tax=Geopsychrobacter electrodiphilus TaxID=225196 RepID=UPI000362BEA7|nr:phosphopentomutase [Geopsychrobacter electrodiphilus]